MNPKYNIKTNKMHLNKYSLLISIILIIATVNCVGKKETQEKAVYLNNSEVIYNGSIYFNEAGCATCHGSTMKGDGPDKGNKNVPDLTAKISANKTATDYFKTITAGSKHPHYQAYTDRGRWAMAHFLYSLSAGIKSGKKGENVNKTRNNALVKAKLETEEIYATNRRWFLGMKKPSERMKSNDPTLKLDTLIGNTKLAGAK